MNIKEQNTKWLLLATTSRKEPEVRHLFDVSFGVLCLEAAGVNPNDILLIIDGNNRDFIQKIISKGSKNTRKIYKKTEFNDVIKSINGADNLMLFVFGHGGLLGIDSTPIISPFEFFNLIDSMKVKRCVTYLGPCNVGIFNYMPVSKKTRKTEIVVIGSTKLHSSISSTMAVKMLDKEPVRWKANIFLFYVFLWFFSPEDIDGDGQFTIIDSYKSAGFYTQDEYKKIKKNNFGDLLLEIPKYNIKIAKLNKKIKKLNTNIENIEALLNAKNKSKDFSNKKAKPSFLKKSADLMIFQRNQFSLELKTEQEKRNELLEISMFNIQEPWILNANPAQTWQYKKATK